MHNNRRLPIRFRHVMGNISLIGWDKLCVETRSINEFQINLLQFVISTVNRKVDGTNLPEGTEWFLVLQYMPLSNRWIYQQREHDWYYISYTDS